jgi:hypothetical protein
MTMFQHLGALRNCLVFCRHPHANHGRSRTLPNTFKLIHWMETNTVSLYVPDILVALFRTRDGGYVASVQIDVSSGKQHVDSCSSQGYAIALETACAEMITLLPRS